MTTPPRNDHPLYQKPLHPVEEGQAQQPPPQMRKRPVEDRPYLTYGLIVVNLLIFLAGFVSDTVQLELFVAGSLFPPLVVEEGQVYRLFTAMFLHGDAAHIFFNMYALYIVGVSLEPIFGRLRFGIVYFLGGLGGSVLSLLLGTYNVPSVGASGAVFAIFTAYAVHLYQHRTIYRNVRGQLQQMIFMLGINLVLGFIPGSRIDNWGHIGGLLGGGILAWFISPHIQPPLAPVSSLSDLAKTDTNPLIRHLPYLVVYVFGLIGLTVLAVNIIGP